MKKLVILAALALAAACSTTAPSGPRAEWRCDGGAAFSVRFNDGAAEVFAGGQLYTLPQTQSGSGIRYANASVEYREHQGQATLSGAHGGPYNNCRRS